MLISVCIPAFNAEAFVSAAVRSALASNGCGTDFDVEVIVVDDASTDGTREVVEGLARQEDGVRIFSNPRRLGIGGNVNRALEVASGALLTILPADCLLTPDGLALRRSELARAPEAALCWGPASFIDQHGETTGGAEVSDAGSFAAGAEALALLLPWNPVFPSTALFTRRAYEVTGGYRWHMTASHMDWDMFIRMAPLGSTVVVPEVVALERVHEGNYTSEAVSSGRTPIYEVLILKEAQRWAGAEHPELVPVVADGLREWARSRVVDAALARAGLRTSSSTTSLGLALAVSPRGALSGRSAALLLSLALPRALSRRLLAPVENRRNRHRALTDA